MRLGAYFWDGWYKRLPAQTDRLLMDFPERMPVWGWLGDIVENMEMQIDYAANAGLCFYAFDWYYPANGNINRMNGCLDRYMQAKNRERLQWCLLVANHDDWRICADAWKDFCNMVVPLMHDGQALKANGKPVLIFFNPEFLIEDLGGEQAASVCMEQLQTIAKNSGLPGVCVVAGCPGVPRDEATGAVSDDAADWGAFCSKLEKAGFNAASGYNYHRPYLKKDDFDNLIYPFEKLSADHEKIWAMFAKHGNLPYMPCVNGGWDCRPWEKGGLYKGDNAVPSCYSPDRTPSTQYQHVKNAGLWLNHNRANALDDLAVVYAWNENGEGGYIEPTIGNNGTILQAVSRGIRESGLSNI